jgi:hypothetical protein
MDEKERERRLNAFYQGLHAKRWAFMTGTINTPPTDAECEPPPELLPPNKAMEDFSEEVRAELDGLTIEEALDWWGLECVDYEEGAR